MSKVLSAPRQRHFPGEQYRAPPQDQRVCWREGARVPGRALLLFETLRVTGLGEGLSAGLARWRVPRAVHDPGKIIGDLVMTLALGGDCLADVAVLRSQPELAGPVASHPVVSRLLTALAADTPGRCGRSAKHARGRERAWALAGERAPGADGTPIPVDIDATIVIARSCPQVAAEVAFKEVLNRLGQMRPDGECSTRGRHD